MNKKNNIKLSDIVIKRIKKQENSQFCVKRQMFYTFIFTHTNLGDVFEKIINWIFWNFGRDY